MRDQTADMQDLMNDVENLQVALEESQRNLRAEREKFTAMLANRDYWTGLYTTEREKRLAAEKDSARLAAVDKILHGRLDSRPNAPALSVYLDNDGAVCIRDDDYSPSKYSGTGGTFSKAIDAAIAQEAANG